MTIYKQDTLPDLIAVDLEYMWNLMDKVIDNIPYNADNIMRPNEAKKITGYLTYSELKKFEELGGWKWLVRYLRRM